MANTIPACFWALYHLLSQPEALQVVQQQVQDILNLSKVEFSSDRDVVISREQLDKLLYLGRLIRCPARTQTVLCEPPDLTCVHRGRH